MFLHRNSLTVFWICDVGNERKKQHRKTLRWFTPTTTELSMIIIKLQPFHQTQIDKPNEICK